MRERRRVGGASSDPRCGGHSLIDLLIATALGLFLVGTAALLYRAQREASALSSDAASMRDAGMTALLMIGQQIEMAGFVPADWLDGGSGDADLAGVGAGIFGCGSVVPARDDDPLACQSLSGESDSVVIRYADEGISTWPSTARQATDCLGQGVGMAGERVVIANRFYVGVSKAGETQLYCEGNGGGSPQPVVAGIERLSVSYWMRGAATPVKAQSIAAGNWSDVVAVDLCVLVRGTRPVSRHRYRACDGALVASPDGHARQTFSRRVALRNHEMPG